MSAAMATVESTVTHMKFRIASVLVPNVIIFRPLFLQLLTTVGSTVAKCLIHILKSNTKLKSYIVPVSYTHLDVYKRQIQITA